jgi:hypothetical protein
MSKVSQNDLSMMLQAVVTALNDPSFSTKTVVIAGKIWKPKDLVQTFESQIDALQASNAAHQAWLQSVSDQRSAYAAIVPLLKGLRAYLAALYGETSQTYRNFGFAPPQKAKPSTETRSAALQQSRATRLARGTMGKKQRLAIKGTVPVTAPAATSPSEPSTTTAPAASSSTANGSGSSH